MSQDTDKISRFWNELKRRKVVRVVTVYAASAFALLELVDIIAEPFGLPDWTIKLVFVILAVGLVVSVVLSWIYDVSPGGHMVKTGSEQTGDSTPQKTSGGWKIATYISFGVIIVLIIINILPRKNIPDEVPEMETSIGVLPFKNMSSEQEYEYFCEGMTDAVITRLSRIEGIGKIPSRTSMMRYKDNELTIPEIASELQVAYILEAGFQKSGEDIKINLNLLDGKSDKAFWSEEYTGKYEDIFQIQAEVAEMVASKLDVDVTAVELADIRRPMTDNVEAYNLYLKGMYEITSFTPEGNTRAIEYMKSAIAVDSTFSLAYAGLANCYLSLAAVHSSELGAIEALELAKPFIDKALSLDPGNSEAHTDNGFYLLYRNWDFAGAEKEYQKAIADDNSQALLLYPDLLNFTGRHEEALIFAERLTRLDPLYPNGRVALSLYYSGEYEKAKDYAKARVARFNNYYSVDQYGFVLLNTGNYEQVVQLYQDFIESPSVLSPRMMGWLGAAYARLGNKEKAGEFLEEFMTLYEEGTAGSPAFYMAVIYAALGNRTLALQWLHESVERHEMEVLWLKTEPQLYDLHDEPTFQELVEKVGFPS